MKPEKFFKIGQVVRRVNDAYLKADVRSNKMKQSGRWSDSLYKIYKVWKTTSAPPSYTLTLFKGRKPSDFKTRVNSHNDTVSVNKFAHDHLQLIIAEEETPTDLMDMAPDAPDEINVGDRVDVAWVRVKYPATPDQTDLSIAYEKIPQWVGTDILSAEWNDKEYYEGTVRSKRQGKVTIDFDDGTVGEMAVTNPTRRIYVSPNEWNFIVIISSTPMVRLCAAAVPSPCAAEQ